MSELSVIECGGQKVLTTAQLAERFGVEPIRLQQNFSNNRARFTDLKHYFSLNGAEIQEFASRFDYFEGQNMAKVRVLYLWTERGAWMLAKSLNTDQAWSAYEMLVDDYYNKQDAKVVPLSKDQALVTVLRTTADLVEGHEEIRKRVDRIERKVDEQITLDSGEQRTLQKTVARRVYSITSEAGEQRRLFRELYREIKDRWAVPSYKDVRRTELQEVIRYIDAWRPRVA